MPPDSVARAVARLLGQRERLEQPPSCAPRRLLLRHPEVAARGKSSDSSTVRNQSRLRSLRREPDGRAAPPRSGRSRRGRKMLIEPPVGWASPVVQWINVDLPAPLGAEAGRRTRRPRSSARPLSGASVPVGVSAS